MLRNAFVVLWTSFLAAASGQITSVYYCNIVLDVFAYCLSETPGITNLPASSIASCFCATRVGSVSWGPSSFDQAILECESQGAGNEFASGFLSDLSSYEGFCTKYGASVGANPTATSVTSMTTTPSSASLASPVSLSSSASSPIQTSSPATSAGATTTAAGPSTPTANPNEAHMQKIGFWVVGGALAMGLTAAVLI